MIGLVNKLLWFSIGRWIVLNDFYMQLLLPVNRLVTLVDRTRGTASVVACIHRQKKLRRFNYLIWLLSLPHQTNLL